MSRAHMLGASTGGGHTVGTLDPSQGSGPALSPHVGSSAVFQSGKNENAVPTNIITYKGRRIPARIDPDASLLRVIEIMAASFGAPEHHITLALRDEEDRLVTQATIASKVSNKETLKLAPSPVTEALAVIASLYAASNMQREPSDVVVIQTPEDTLPLKLALFNLQKYIKEDDFVVEFMLKGGVRLLVNLLEKETGGLTGNSLAYALQGIRGIMDFEHGWGDFSDHLIDRILLILTTSSAPNIVRPATIVVRKLVVASPMQVPAATASPSMPPAVSPAKGKEKQIYPNGSGVVNQYGFDRVFARMAVVGAKVEDDHDSPPADRVFRAVVKRLEGRGDLELIAQSLGLVNACLRSAQQENSKRYSELIGIVESLGTRKYVARLIPTCSNNIVEPRILDFQTRYANILRHRALRPVRPQQNDVHERYLAEIWGAGSLDADDSAIIASPHASRVSVVEYHRSTRRTWEGWRKMGLNLDHFDNQSMAVEGELFRTVGELGLECLHYYAIHEDDFHTVVLEQQVRQVDKRCPIGRASAECVNALYEHYKISQSGQRGAAHFQPFMLNFPRLHSLVLRFFLRMWHDSESRLDDFDRVSYLVRSHIRLSLADEHLKTWLNLEQDFLLSEYSEIRDRQMELLDKEDGMLERPAVNDLREKVSHEAYDVMAEQRIICMLQGSWFNSAIVITKGIIESSKARPDRPLRFVRLSTNRRTLAWGEFSVRPAETPTFDSLKERVDLTNVTDIRLQTGCAIGARSPDLVSKLSFSLMSGTEHSLLDLDAVHAAQMAEWTDGLRILKGESGMSTQDTSNYIHILTELALKIRLLDITGDGIGIPRTVTFGTAPKSTDFWFAS